MGRKKLITYPPRTTRVRDGEVPILKRRARAAHNMFMTFMIKFSRVTKPDNFNGTSMSHRDATPKIYQTKTDVTA